jgi:hypothetical protein
MHLQEDQFSWRGAPHKAGGRPPITESGRTGRAPSVREALGAPTGQDPTHSPNGCSLNVNGCL